MTPSERTYPPHDEHDQRGAHDLLGAGDPPFWITRLEVRRATFAVLLHADGPLRVAEIVERLERDEVVALGPSANRRISDLLRWQVTAGRVHRTALSELAADPRRYRTGPVT